MEQSVKRGRRWTRALVRTGAGAAALVLLAGTAAALWTQYRFQEPYRRTWSRALGPELAWQRAKYPSIDWVFAIADRFLDEDNRHDFAPVANTGIDPLSISSVVGPRVPGQPVPARYTQDGIPLPVMFKQHDDVPGHVIESLPSASPVVVSDEKSLARAIRDAHPGDHILLAPGTYEVRHTLEATASGTAESPIFLRAAKPGDVRLQIRSAEGMTLYGAFWVIENLSFSGTCTYDEFCEHALHVVGGARSTVIRNNEFRNFNAPLKVNLSGRRDRMPDFGLVEGNRFSNDRPRNTSRPVTLIDIVGANGWRITSNFIADFAKDGGDYTSYAAFIKGASRGGVMERNLVVCEWKHTGGVRLGLSLGGGGTADYACRDNACAFENDGGVIRNNVILNCPNDVGIYLNKASNAVVHNNLVVSTRGLDVRYVQTNALVFNNIIDGRVLERDGGEAELDANVTPGWRAAFLEKVSRNLFRDARKGDFSVLDREKIAGRGRALASGLSDFCGCGHNPDMPDIGPFALGKQPPCSVPGLFTGN